MTEDIADFFPSVSKKLVEKVWSSFFAFSLEVSEILTSITTCEGSLPQGAPSSTYLANLVLFDAEPDVVDHLARKGMTYTRHVDDINISSAARIDNRTRITLRNLIDDMLRARGLRLNARKEIFRSTSEPCRVHGLLVNSGKPTRGRREIAKIRAAVHKLEQAVTDPHSCQSTVEALFRHALGKTAELNQYQDRQARPLRTRVEKIRQAARLRWTRFGV